MSPVSRISHSPPSHDDELSGTGLQSRSRNARAQARHRAKRKKYIDELEESVKRLQAIVDAAGLDPNAFPQMSAPAHTPAHPYLRELQDDNARLRRESDALRVQIAALSAHVSAGAHVTPLHYAPSPPPSDVHSPPPERDHKRRKMSVERDHLYLDHRPGRTSPASASSSSLANSSVHTATPSTSASSLVHPMLSSLQHQAVYNSLFTPSSTQSHPSRPATPPVPVSSYSNIPSNSLLATSLYPLLTLGIAGGAVSGELGAAAWNAFQQSQMSQQPSLASLQGHSSLGQGLGHGHLGSSSMPPPNLGSIGNHSGLGQTSLSALDHTSYMSQSQPMSALDSIRTSSPAARPSSPSSSSRFDSHTSASRYDPVTSSRFDPVFDPPTASPHLISSNGSPHMISSTSTSSPHMITSTPPTFGSGRRSSSSSYREDGL